MKRCPFTENEYCVENNCFLWYEDCLMQQIFIRHFGGENKIEELIHQSADCSM